MSLVKKTLLKKRVEVVFYRDPIDPEWFIGLQLRCLYLIWIPRYLTTSHPSLSKIL